MKTFNPVTLEDLQDSFNDLRELYGLIIEISNNKAAARVLLDAALFECACVNNSIQDLGGNGFSSLDDTADFIFDVQKTIKK